MAKLDVKVIDMKDGQVEKIAFEGEEYVKVDDGQHSERIGDIVVGKKGHGRSDSYFKVLEIGEYNGKPNGRFKSEDGRIDGMRHYEVFRSISELNKLTYNGVDYRKVTDRDAQEGDYVVFGDVGERSYLIDGKPYKITEIDSFGDPQIIDEDGDSFDIYGEQYEIYELVWKKGDKVRNKGTGKIVEVYAYQPTKRTYGAGEGSPFAAFEEGFTYIDDENYEYWAEIKDYELVEESAQTTTATITFLDGTTQTLLNVKAITLGGE